MTHARDILLGTRFKLDLFMNLRPIRCFAERLNPLKNHTAEDIDFVVFRENTEDLYAGIEFESFSQEAEKFKNVFREMYPDEFAKIRFPDSSGFSLKPISKEGIYKMPAILCDVPPR